MKNSKVVTLEVGLLKTNCYLVESVSEKSSECLIIDPGDDADYIIQKITDNVFKPKAIFLTHGHYDHVLAATELQLVYNIPLFLNPKDLFLYKKSADTAYYFEKTKNALVSENPLPYQKKYLNTVNKFSFKVLNTPGHTPGSVSIYFPSLNALFVGDLVFSDLSLGSSDHKYSNKQHLYKSVKQILEFPEKTIIYSGHGAVSTIKTLKKYLLNNK